MKTLLCLLIFFPAACLATDNQIDFNLGRGTPMSSIQAGSSSDLAGSRGTNWSADFLHQAGRSVYAGIGGGQFRSNDNVSETFVPNADSTLKSRTTSILLLTRANIYTQGRWIPYLIVGAGWVKNSLTITSDQGQSATILDDSKNTLGYASGIGLEYNLSDAIVIGAEARYQSSVKRTFALTPQGQALTGRDSVDTSLTALMIGVKLGIKY